MAVTPRGVGEKVSPIISGQIFARSMNFPVTPNLELTFDVAFDLNDGLGSPGRVLQLYNYSAAAGQDLWLSVAPDPHHFSRDIYVPHGFNWYIMAFDGVLIHMVRLKASATMVDQPFVLTVSLGLETFLDPRTRVHLPEISEIDPSKTREVVLPDQLTI